MEKTHKINHTDTQAETSKHAYIQTFNGPFSGTTQVSRYQKGKTNLDFTEARDIEWHSINKLNSFHFFPNPGHFDKADLMHFTWCNVQRCVKLEALLVECSSTGDAVNTFPWPTALHVLLTHQLIS